MIYLDNAATTRVFDNAVQAAERAMTTDFFNPNATYKSAVFVNDNLENARKQIAAVVGARADELVFTSCATESNNWVFNNGIKNKNGNIVISAGEHSSVYECAMQLKSRGYDVRIAPLTRNGYVDLCKLEELVDKNTALVSIIHVSNETGVVNPIKQIVQTVRAKNEKTLIHSDGVQGMLKTTDGISGLGVDYYSASAHKLGAPKGIGLLYIRHGLNISPLLRGGGQEHGLRSGTQNIPYIMSFASAVKEFADSLANCAAANGLRRELCGYFGGKDGYKVIGEGPDNGFILCLCINGIKAEILQNVLHDRGVIIGKGAACSGSKRGNRVLAAMGLDARQIEGCVRLSFFVDTTKQDAMRAAEIINNSVQELRSKYVR